MSDSAASKRIVPDVEQSVSAQHLRYRKGPSIWPLWFALIVILALFAASAVGLWYERERLLDEVNGISGEVSNMHARLDSGDTQMQDAITLLQAQMGTLFQEQEQLSSALNNTRDELFSLIPASEEMVSTEMVETLLADIEAQQEAAQAGSRQLTQLNASLEQFEQEVADSRQQLSEQMANVETQLERRDAVLSDSIDALNRQWETQQNQLQRLEQQLAEEAARDNADAISRTEVATQISAVEQSWQQELEALESDLRQVRQAQLALSAQLEMLR
ncbi:hypothetical protein ACU6TU_08675 [Halomonas sp. LS-001]